jgi:hypothetical protein
MHRLLILVSLLGLEVIVADAQAPTGPPESPREVVEQFYKMEAEGRWLGPERWDELQEFLTEVGRWSPGVSIAVLRSYDIGDARKDVGYKGVVDYQVEVDYFEWGSIDSFLNFRRARGPGGQTSVAGEPVEQQTYETLVLTDKFAESTRSGEKQETGALRWRMSLLAPPAVSVDTALRWVTETRDKSIDPLIKYNADRSTAILKSLSMGTLPSMQPAGTVQESPSDVAKHFIALEGRLMPSQWDKVANFFAETPKPKWDHANIVDIVGTGVDTSGSFGEAEVSTNSLGKLDSSMRLSNYPSMRLPLAPPSASACFGDDRFGFSLLLSDKHWEIGANGIVKELAGPPAWRIEDTSFEPLLTLDTAIRYVSQVRDRAAASVVKSNAAKTLRILNYYKRGKPLPAELSSDVSGGCG